MLVENKNYEILRLPGRPPALLDFQVAEIFGIETKEINRAVANNPEKFPPDFLFELNRAEVSVVEILNRKTRYLPKAYTWEGCNMLATIIKNPVAVNKAIQIIRGFTALEKQVPRLLPMKKPQPNLRTIASELKAAKAIAKLFGLGGTNAIMSANNVVKTMLGVDCARMISFNCPGDHDKVSRYYTPTEIGIKMSPMKTPGAVNKVLEDKGFQTAVKTEKGEMEWQLTEMGKEFGVAMDTGRIHSNGQPILQIKWKEDLLETLCTQ